MQANTITVQTDAAGDDVIVPEVYTRAQETLNKTTYEGPQHSLVLRDILQLSRVAPKPNSISRGSAKTKIKFTLDVEVANPKGDGTITMAAIGEVSYSLPIGMTVADQMILCERLHALSGDQVVRTPLVERLHI